MGFRSLVRIDNIRYFFALRHHCQSGGAVEIDSGTSEMSGFSFRKAGAWIRRRLFRMIHRIQFEQWAPIAIEKVFLFFANPSNLPRIMPPETGTELAALKLVPPHTIPTKQ